MLSHKTTWNASGLAIMLALFGCQETTAPKASPATNATQDSSPAKAPSQITSDAAPHIQLLIQKIDQANSKCRDLPGDSTEGIAACEKRDHLMQEAKMTGWCWGPQGGYGYEQHWIQCSKDPAHTPKRQWYAHDINHANCMPSPSPADKIREIKEFGQTPRTNDLATGAVEVEVDIGNGKSQVWTFYRVPESCEASLPSSQKIDSKYE